MTIRIIGAGMAGLLAGAMLRNECEVIYEAKGEVPNNHHAVLRFRSSVVGDVLNIPFNQVQVMRAVQANGNAIADAMDYSQKCTGMARLDRSIASANGSMVPRYIAPPDLIGRMEQLNKGKFKFNCAITPSQVQNRERMNPWISTIPMPEMMILSGWTEQMAKPRFESVAGVTVTVTLEGLSAYCSLYVPNPNRPFSRISITGNIMHIEFPMPGINPVEHDLIGEFSYGLDDAAALYAAEACELVGLTSDHIKTVTAHEQPYAKILPIKEETRKRFLLWLTEEFNIYSLGRFATWRPGLLLDDVVNDVRVINRLINGASTYDHVKG